MKAKPPLNLLPGCVDGRPYRVVDMDGWAVLAADGSNAYEAGWRWNTRAGARAYRHECEGFGHPPNTGEP